MCVCVCGGGRRQAWLCVCCAVEGPTSTSTGSDDDEGDLTRLITSDDESFGVTCDSVCVLPPDGEPRISLTCDQKKKRISVGFFLHTGSVFGI